MGERELDTSVDSPMTVAGLLSELERRYPPLATLRSSLMVGVNDEYAAHETQLKSGDVIALIPPVSGG